MHQIFVGCWIAKYIFFPNVSEIIDGPGGFGRDGKNEISCDKYISEGPI